MTGKIKILKKTLREIINTHREEDGDAFEANVAVWLYNSDGERYMTLELSPRSRVMRYAAAYKLDSEPLGQFIRRKGGVNSCAARFSRRLGRRASARTAE
jgi:hypothetical protein